MTGYFFCNSDRSVPTRGGMLQPLASIQLSTSLSFSPNMLIATAERPWSWYFRYILSRSGNSASQVVQPGKKKPTNVASFL